jgi:hexulose-6-phosphate isomerase
MMKKGISYWSFEGGLEGTKDIIEAMKEASRKGYDAIELCVDTAGALTPKTSDRKCAEILRAAKDIGIEISSLASGVGWKYNIVADSKRERQKALDFNKGYIELAAKLKAGAVLYLPGSVSVFFDPSKKVVPYDVAYRRAQQALRKLAPTAEKNRIYICVEYVWNMFLLSPLEFRDFLDSASTRYVGAYFDVGNVMLTGFPEQWIRILGRRIKRVHFKDFKRSVGTAAGFCDLMKGDVDWPGVIRAFKDVKYDGYVVAEMMPPDKTLLRRTSRAMDKILGRT